MPTRRRGGDLVVRPGILAAGEHQPFAVDRRGAVRVRDDRAEELDAVTYQPLAVLKAVRADGRADRTREMRAPLVSIFKRGVLGNTLTACWWMASCMGTYYSIWGLFATHLQKDLGLSPGLIATPVAIANLLGFLAMGFWGWIGDVLGRRWSMILPAAIGLFVTPIYLLSTDPFWIIGGFLLQGLFAGAMYSQMPSFLTERFPTEVRATAAGFCFHQATIFGGLVPPVLTFFAINHQMGFAIPMLIGTTCGLISVIVALLLYRILNRFVEASR